MDDAGAGGEAPATTGALRGRWVSLRPVLPEDWRFLYEIAMDPDVGITWRYSGAHVDPEAFRASLWADVLVQFVIVANRTGESVGVVAARGADFRNGHVHMAGALHPAYLDTGWPIEGMVLFVDHVFRTWPMRRIYFESVEHVAERYSSFASRYMTLEGRLEEHMFRNGRYEDLLIYVLTRAGAEEASRRLLRRPGTAAPASPAAPVPAVLPASAEVGRDT